MFVEGTTSVIAPIALSALDLASLVILTGDKDALTRMQEDGSGHGDMGTTDGHDKRAVKMFGGWEELSFRLAGRRNLCSKCIGVKHHYVLRGERLK